MTIPIDHNWPYFREHSEGCPYCRKPRTQLAALACWVDKRQKYNWRATSYWRLYATF